MPIPVSHDIDLLAKIVTLPQRPLSAQWLITSRGDGFLGPKDEAITAVLRYPPEAIPTMLAACPILKVEFPIPLHDWYPSELKRWTAKDNKTLDMTGPRYTPAPFFKSPFLGGYLVAEPESGLLLLYLQTR
jgi:hypothetical protein